MPEPYSPPVRARFAAFAHNVLAPGLALLMLNIAFYSGTVSLFFRENSGARMLLMTGAYSAGIVLGIRFFPRLLEWARRDENRTRRVRTALWPALWIAAAPLAVLPGLRQYVFNESLRVFANVFLGMALAPGYQLFFARFPVRRQGTWFGCCIGAGVLCANILFSLANFLPPAEDALFHPLQAPVYLIHAGSLVVFAALCIHALTTRRAAPPEETPRFAPPPGQGDNRKPVRALIASMGMVYFLSGVIGAKLTPVFPGSAGMARDIVLSVFAVMAAPAAGWLVDKRPESVFRRFLPVCCTVFVLTPALAVMETTHALHMVLQPVAVAAQFSLLTVCSVAAAGLARDAATAMRYAGNVLLMRILFIVSTMICGGVLRLGSGATVFVATILGFCVYRLGAGVRNMFGSGGKEAPAGVGEAGDDPGTETVLDEGGAERKAEAVAAFLSKGGLTPRERETAALLLGGLPSQDIAEALSISEWTVKKHTTNIYRKFSVDGRFEFLRLFVDETNNPIHNKE